MYVCMYVCMHVHVCMSVRNGFTIEIYRFMHSLRIFWQTALRMSSRDGMEIEVEGSEHRR